EIADELSYSAKSIIRYATDRGVEKNFLGRPVADAEPRRDPPPAVTGYANDLLLLIGDPRFCRAIVESSPGTALAIFHEIGEAEKYGVQVEVFGKNIVNEAIVNENSFLYREAEPYETGLMGYHKPLSQAIFANYRLVEVVNTLLDPDLESMWKWRAAQW